MQLLKPTEADHPGRAYTTLAIFICQRWFDIGRKWTLDCWFRGTCVRSRAALDQGVHQISLVSVALKLNLGHFGLSFLAVTPPHHLPSP